MKLNIKEIVLSYYGFALNCHVGMFMINDTDISAEKVSMFENAERIRISFR